MPNPVNHKRGEQWDRCDRCGTLSPMRQLVKQKGLLVHSTRGCWDNLQVERRYLDIERILGGGEDDWEGRDTRVVDRGFFEGFDESNM